MIGTLLVFALGFLAASLLALLFVPFLWQKAQSLARRRFDAEIPASVREMQGEVDAVRARAAFDLRHAEMRAGEAQGRATAERSEAGRIVLENGTLRTQLAARDAEIVERQARLDEAEQMLTDLRGERDEIVRDRQALRDAFERRGGELEMLQGRHAASLERVAGLQERLAHLEHRLGEQERSPEPLTASVENAPQPLAPTPMPVPTEPTARRADPATPLTGGERLRAAIAAGVGPRAPASRTENAEIRERISDLAARIVRRQVDAEGPASPIAAILARDEPKPEASGNRPSLTERIRALGMGPDAPPPPPAADGASNAPATRKDGGGRSRRRSRR